MIELEWSSTVKCHYGHRDKFISLPAGRLCSYNLTTTAKWDFWYILNLYSLEMEGKILDTNSERAQILNMF